MFDRGLAILCDHLFDCRAQQARQLLLGLYQRTVTNAGLLLDAPQRNAPQVMLHCYMGQKSVAVQALGQYPRRARTKAPPALRTNPAPQTIKHLHHLRRSQLGHRTLALPFAMEPHAAVRARLSFHLHRFHQISFRLFDALTPVSNMPRPPASASLLRVGQGVRLERHL